MATDDGLTSVLRNAKLLLLDFDGPVTALMVDGRSQQIADSMRLAMGDDSRELPVEMVETEDPILLLRYIREVSYPRFSLVEDVCVSGEVDAARHSMPTDGIESLLAVCAARRLPIVIVSNNSGTAVSTFLNVREISTSVAAVIGRPNGYPELMKPSANLLDAAIALFRVHPEECVMYGDSVTDVEAASRVGVHMIGHAKSHQRELELRSAGAAATFRSLSGFAARLALR